MPYRAQLGGIFGSGLYPKQPPQNNAGDIIDAVTRGATTLIGGAYARKLAEREQARQDAADKLAQRAADRADQHDQWERTRAESQDAIATRREQRADFESGYTPASSTTKDVVQPGSVESSGLFGAPGKVTAPSITKQTATIPSAYNFAQSKTGLGKAMDLKTGEVKRGERMTDAKTLATFREDLRKNRPGGASDTQASRASTAVRAQINEANTRIKTLEAQKTRLHSGLKPGDQEKSDAIDAQLSPMITRRDSLANVNDQIAGRLTSEAGISTGSPTIKGAYAGQAAKPNGSTIRGGGESSDAAARIPGAGPTSRQPVKGASTVRIGRGATAPNKGDGSTVRAPATAPVSAVKKDGSTDRTTTGGGSPAKKETITQAEATALKARGFTDGQLRKKYLIQ